MKTVLTWATLKRPLAKGPLDKSEALQDSDAAVPKEVADTVQEPQD